MMQLVQNGISSLQLPENRLNQEALVLFQQNCTQHDTTLHIHKELKKGAQTRNACKNMQKLSETAVQHDLGQLNILNLAFCSSPNKCRSSH